MIHTWQQLTYIHGLGAELPSHVFNPDKQVYHSQKAFMNTKVLIIETVNKCRQICSDPKQRDNKIIEMRCFKLLGKDTMADLLIEGLKMKE